MCFVIAFMPVIPLKAVHYFNESVSFSPSIRATMSVPPPGGAPTISLTGPSNGDSLTAGAMLTGTADATGSTLVALSYVIDGGAVMPMIFETYGDCTVAENRGYSVVLAGV